MGAPSLTLSNYTFPFDQSGWNAVVRFGSDDGRVRSVELEALHGSSEGFYLTQEGDNVQLNFPTISRVETEERVELYRKIPLKFVVGYTDYTDEEYEQNNWENDPFDIIYTRYDIDVYATTFDGKPEILFIDNLASKVTDVACVVVHGRNMTDGLEIRLDNGESVYIVDPEDIRFTIDSTGEGTAEFTVAPGMLAKNADGTEPCAQYDVYFSYGEEIFKNNGGSLIRYKYDSDTEDQQKYSTEDFTREKRCYETGSLTLVQDTVDENGNTVTNAAADPRLGNDIYVRIGHYEGGKEFDVPMETYGLRTEKVDKYVLNEGDLVHLTAQPNDYDNGYWIVHSTDWKHVYNCDEYFYTMVRVKYNKNLVHKAGLLKLNGVQLDEGDVVWLAGQMVTEENGLWVVSRDNWYGYNPDPDHEFVLDCPADCYVTSSAYPVGDNVLIDLGVKATYPVDYVCSNNVAYKCGSRTICNYKVSPGNVVALLNQDAGENGIYLVTCGMWVKLSDVSESDIHGTDVDFTRSVVVQNDIDFCDCGGVFHIDYYFLTPSCYMHHLRRTVKILCAGASIAPNATDKQFVLTEYLIRTGEEDALIGYQGRTPGDPVKESCTVDNEDFDQDFGMHLVEHRQYVKELPEPQCMPSPMCTSMCNIPKLYTLDNMPNDYKNSNDRNGFTIKFWRYEEDGWHLYAYIGSGTQATGMDYYVYHLHVKGKAVETLVDVNEHSWFSVHGGVIATGDGADEFCLCDDNWAFVVHDADGNVVIDETTHMPKLTYNLRDDDSLYQKWRISCTTNICAHYIADDDRDARILRTNCDLMKKYMVAAIGDMCEDCVGTGIDPDTGDVCPTCGGDGKNPDGYLVGMTRLFGVAYYTEAMPKSQFVKEYNKYDPECLWIDIVEYLVTDENTPNIGTSVIATDRTDEFTKEGLRR